MLLRHFIFNPATYQPVEVDLPTWSAWYEDQHRLKDGGLVQVALDQVGQASVSTVFMGVTHNPTANPNLWESTVFNGPPWEDRYASYKEAILGHHRLVQRLRQDLETQTQEVGHAS